MEGGKNVAVFSLAGGVRSKIGIIASSSSCCFPEEGKSNGALYNNRGLHTTNKGEGGGSNEMAPIKGELASVVNSHRVRMQSGIEFLYVVRLDDMLLLSNLFLMSRVFTMNL